MQVHDAHGVLVPNGQIKVSFHVSGPASLAAVASGDPLDLTSTFIDTRRTYRGRMVGIVRPGSATTAPTSGTVTVTASSPGLPDAKVSIQIEQ